MSLPGLSLPGLTTPTINTITTSQATSQPPRRQDLEPQSEWRFEVATSGRYSIRVETGTAEYFGVELAPKQTHVFSGCKGAIFTWQGCQLEVSGDAESEYAGQETGYANEWLDLHGTLEERRKLPGDGPRVLVAGPDSVGKTSLVRTLAAWAVRGERQPVVVNLDPREGLLAPPGTCTAVVVSSQMDVEGYGVGPMSGPTTSPMRTPLIHHFPHASPLDKPEVYKATVTRLALSVMSRLTSNPAANQAGIIVDTPGLLNDPKSNYDLLSHVIMELSIDVVVVMASERLYSDMARKFGAKSSDEPVTLLKVSKPGGAVERDHAFMKAGQAQQMRQYFFGSSKESLNPHSHVVPFADISILRPKATSTSDSSGLGPGMEDDEDYDVPYNATKSTNYTIFEPVAPTSAMMGGLVAIKFCSSASDEHTIRDSAVMGFLYVAEVDETRKRIRFLAPHPQRWGDRALVWGAAWPEAVADLVT